jgi:pimeloyl-ACP methyl ester carboxylesterase
MDIQIVTTDDGTRITYRMVGHGPQRIALIHGFNCTSKNFDWLLPYFPAEHYTLLLPDLRGSGHSDKPATGYSIERFARDILEVLRHVNWSSYTLVGHSTGGAIAQWIAAEPEQPLTGLILAGPVPATGLPLPPEGRAMFEAAAESAAGKAAIWRMGWSGTLTSELLDTLVQDSQTWRREAVLETFAAWSGASFPERLPHIHVPTLVIGAEHEPFLTEAFLREKVVAPIRNARFALVPRSNHYMHIEQAAFTAGLITAFLALQAA